MSANLIKKERDEKIADGKAFKQRKPVSSSELDGVKQERYSQCNKPENLSASLANVPKNLRGTVAVRR